MKLENKKKKTSLLIAELIVATLGLVLILAVVTSNGVQQAKAEDKEVGKQYPNSCRALCDDMKEGSLFRKTCISVCQSEEGEPLVPLSLPPLPPPDGGSTPPPPPKGR